MKVIKGLEKKEVCGVTVLVPVGEESADFSNLIMLNDTSAFLWQEMTKGDFTAQSLTARLLEEYDVEASVAAADVDNFIAELRKAGLLEQ